MKKLQEKESQHIQKIRVGFENVDKTTQNDMIKDLHQRWIKNYDDLKTANDIASEIKEFATTILERIEKVLSEKYELKAKEDLNAKFPLKASRVVKEKKPSFNSKACFISDLLGSANYTSMMNSSKAQTKTR